jgi:hypothetical protein
MNDGDGIILILLISLAAFVIGNYLDYDRTTAEPTLNLSNYTANIYTGGIAEFKAANQSYENQLHLNPNYTGNFTVYYGDKIIFKTIKGKVLPI